MIPDIQGLTDLKGGKEPSLCATNPAGMVNYTETSTQGFSDGLRVPDLSAYAYQESVSFVLAYWHVERKSLCIHSQLKSPSSSEVASMIEGVMRHCTELEVDRQYVDSHGQSVVAFAFTKLLGFQLMPQLKAIHSQRLYRPEAGKSDVYPNLQPVLSRPIDWELIRR